MLTPNPNRIPFTFINESADPRPVSLRLGWDVRCDGAAVSERCWYTINHCAYQHWHPLALRRVPDIVVWNRHGALSAAHTLADGQRLRIEGIEVQTEQSGDGLSVSIAPVDGLPDPGTRLVLLRNKRAFAEVALAGRSAVRCVLPTRLLISMDLETPLLPFSPQGGRGSYFSVDVMAENDPVCIAAIGGGRGAHATAVGFIRLPNTDRTVRHP